MSTESLHLVCVVSVDPTKLTRNGKLSHLPEMLDAAVSGVSPALDMEKLFLVEGKYTELVSAVNRMAVNYHRYCVEKSGDVCELAGCAEHVPMAEVIPLFRRG